MLPIGDDNLGRRRRPYVVKALLIANLAVFIYQLTLSERELFNFFYRWGVVPDGIVAGERLYTLLTCAFLHGGFLHLGSNLLFLWIFGDNIEDIFGHFGFALFYALTAVIANVAQVMINTDSQIPLVGASGAIAGILAAYLRLFPHGRVRALVMIGFFPLLLLVPAWFMIGFWALIQVLNGALSLGVLAAAEAGGVAYFAHIGGFAAGLLLTGLFTDERALARQRAARAQGRFVQRFR